MIHDTLNDEDFKMESEVSNAKIRYEESKSQDDGEENEFNSSDNTTTSDEEKEQIEKEVMKAEACTRNTYNKYNKVINMRELKATYMPGNSMRILPKPINKKLEAEIIVRSNIFK